LSFSSLSSLSSSKSFSSSIDTTEDDEISRENSWAEILGSDWWGRGILGSETSLGSELGLDIPKLVSLGHGSDSSSSSRYSGDVGSDVESDILEVLDEKDDEDDKE
jgi:hypothetical protein